MDTMRTLKQVILFKDVPDPVLEIVTRIAEEISVPAGETIVGAADTPDRAIARSLAARLRRAVRMIEFSREASP